MVTKTGTAGSDTLLGTSANDILNGLSGNDSLLGQDGIDTLLGGAGNDVLLSGKGADLLNGGNGIDTATYGDATEGVIVNLLFGTGAGSTATGDTLVGIENVNGSAFKDFILGSTADNLLKGLVGTDTLFGLGGNDVLVGGAGNDVLRGDKGVDTADYAGSAQGVFASLQTGALGDAQGDSYESVENLTGSSHDDQLDGDFGNNVLKGLGGADLLRGSSGNDTMLGGDGNDVMFSGDGADRLEGGNGIDTAEYRSSSLTVNLALGTGSGGEAQGDVLVSIENVNGSDGNDVLIGSGVANVMRGRFGNDTLDGGAGNDKLDGLDGVDRLTGGSGADHFEFSRADHVGVGIGLRDVITDFSHAQADKIDLSAIDARPSDAVDDAFEFFGEGGLFDTPGQMRYVFDGANTVIQVNLDGGFNADPDMEIVLFGHINLVASDFVL